MNYVEFYSHLNILTTPMIQNLKKVNQATPTSDIQCDIKIFAT